MSLKCTLCDQVVGRYQTQDNHEREECSNPGKPLCRRKCPSGYSPDCQFTKGHLGPHDNEYIPPKYVRP